MNNEGIFRRYLDFLLHLRYYCCCYWCVVLFDAIPLRFGIGMIFPGVTLLPFPIQSLLCVASNVAAFTAACFAADISLKVNKREDCPVDRITFFANLVRLDCPVPEVLFLLPIGLSLPLPPPRRPFLLLCVFFCLVDACAVAMVASCNSVTSS